LVARRDVPRDADHAHGAAGLVVVDAAALGKPAHATVRLQHAELDLVGSIYLHCRVDRGGDVLAVLGVDDAEEAFDRGTVLACIGGRHRRDRM
jgi:hypothetical protein